MRVVIPVDATACPSCKAPRERGTDWPSVWGHRCPHGEPCPAGGADVTCSGCGPVPALAPAKRIDPAGRMLPCAICTTPFQRFGHDQRTKTCSPVCRERLLARHRATYNAKVRLTAEQKRQRSRDDLRARRADHPEWARVRNRVDQRRHRGQEPEAADLEFLANYWTQQPARQSKNDRERRGVVV